jgi:hypothetical protein
VSGPILVRSLGAALAAQVVVAISVDDTENMTPRLHLAVRKLQQVVDSVVGEDGNLTFPMDSDHVFVAVASHKACVLGALPLAEVARHAGKLTHNRDSAVDYLISTLSKNESERALLTSVGLIGAGVETFWDIDPPGTGYRRTIVTLLDHRRATTFYAGAPAWLPPPVRMQ